MNDALDARALCRVEKLPRVLDSGGVLEIGVETSRRLVFAIVEAHPVGVVQYGCAAHRRDEFVGRFEVERMRLDLAAERICTVNGIRQRANAVSLFQQSRRDVFA